MILLVIQRNGKHGKNEVQLNIEYMGIHSIVLEFILYEQNRL